MGESVAFLVLLNLDLTMAKFDAIHPAKDHWIEHFIYADVKAFLYFLLISLLLHHIPKKSQHWHH